MSNTMEMFKSKGIILFIVIMLGISYLGSLRIEKLDNQNINKNEIVLNK